MLSKDVPCPHNERWQDCAGKCWEKVTVLPDPTPRDPIDHYTLLQERWVRAEGRVLDLEADNLWLRRLLKSRNNIISALSEQLEEYRSKEGETSGE